MAYKKFLLPIKQNEKFINKNNKVQKVIKNYQELEQKLFQIIAKSKTTFILNFRLI